MRMPDKVRRKTQGKTKWKCFEPLLLNFLWPLSKDKALCVHLINDILNSSSWSGLRIFLESSPSSGVVLRKLWRFVFPTGSESWRTRPVLPFRKQPGLANNSILFCWFFTIECRCTVHSSYFISIFKATKLKFLENYAILKQLPRL